MEKWFVAAKKADFEEWGKRFGISPITARLIRNRDILTPEEAEKYLNGSFLDLYPPELMTDMEDAAAILEEQIRLGSQIRVIGDYDVDGVTAAHILTKGLRELGARVDTVIPHRVRDGYGLSEQLIEDAAKQGVRTILTCDNGIAAAQQTEMARQLGMTVIVTDHHEVPFLEKNGVREEILPDAAAVVDPKRKDCAYPCRNICGAAVAYKLTELLLRRFRTEPEKKQRLLDEFLQLTAMDTVCDVCDLLDENRILVKEGLKRLRHDPCVGMKALMDVNQIRPENLNAYHLGFVLGPCLNATGRLDTAARALELLEAEDTRTAVTAAEALKEMNESRKTMTLAGVEEAVACVEREGLSRDKVLVVFLPECHESLAGIIAGRVRERYGKPVFVLTRGEEGIKGSGRSIEGYHMYEAMSACGELFTKFGGHKMAAGFSMKEEDIPRLRRKLNEQCALTEEDLIPKVHIDMVLPLCRADRKLAEETALLEPFGTANPKPLFVCRDLLFQGGVRMGSGGNCARYRVLQDGKSYQMVYFGDLDGFHTFLDQKFGQGAAERLYEGRGEFPVSVTYQLNLRTYMGKTEAQLVMRNFC